MLDGVLSPQRDGLSGARVSLSLPAFGTNSRLLRYREALFREDSIRLPDSCRVHKRRGVILARGSPYPSQNSMSCGKESGSRLIIGWLESENH
ncbi:Uncharacterized protein HZ326_30756 [Fusarium oxysporum f. sp. albedinis]|nr:Uncharacterized protein HZ326_30756 [Fusarium oxysporum f. sp. albedinis]